MSARRGVMVVLTDVDEALDAEFNEWYDEEHVPERVAVPGVRGARRFRRVDDAPQPPTGTIEVDRGPKYLVIYEFDDLDAIHGAWKEIGTRHSARSRRMYAAMSATIRESYELIGEFGAAEHSAAEHSAVEEPTRRSS